MKTQNASWIIFIAALGMMSTLMSGEIRELTTWSEMVNPRFVATLLAHFGTVIGAFIAGRLMPDNRNGKRTRHYDNDESNG